MTLVHHRRDNTQTLNYLEFNTFQLPMRHLTSTGQNILASSSVFNLSIPVDCLIVDNHGGIHFAASDVSSLVQVQPVPLLGSNISEVFGNLLTPVDYEEFFAFLADSKSGSFYRRYQSIETPSRSLSITGHPFPVPDKGNGWLLITQDVSTWQKVIDQMACLASDLEAIRQAEKRALDAAAASLIDTNVALRREIRDRQNTLEKLSISEARFRNLTETTSDFIWEINSAGNYTYASPKSVKLLGLEPQTLLGTPFLPLRNAESAGAFIKIIELGGQPRHGFSKMEYDYMRQDGFEVTVESSGEPIFSKRNKCVGFRGIDRDVTERRIYETQLQQAKDSAESANHAKSEFLANMSHELRTPLHAILSFAKYGEKRIESASRKDLFRFFSQITTSGQRLLPLIDSLLDLAKLESGKMVYDFQDHDLLAEFISAVHEITPLADKKGLFFKFTPTPVATVACFDQATIAQVIRNLLANGVKFSDHQTTITISFDVFEDSKAQHFLKTTISNYGVKIPADDMGTIFDKFAQSSKTKNGAGGTGLGLSICKQIIEDHGGTICAGHGETGDTRFHFTLPVHRQGENSI